MPDEEIAKKYFIFTATIIKSGLYLLSLKQFESILENIFRKKVDRIFKDYYLEVISIIAVAVFVVIEHIYFRQYILELHPCIKIILFAIVTITTGIYSFCKAIWTVEKGDAAGISIKDDEVFIPYILDQLNDERLKSLIGHELYTYSTRARFYKICYYISAFITLIAPAIVIVLNIIENGNVYIKLGVSCLSGLASIASGMAGIVKFKESWVRYRSNCEKVKHELVYYVQGCTPYNESDINERKKKLIENIYDLAKQEEMDWNRTTRNSNGI